MLQEQVKELVKGKEYLQELLNVTESPAVRRYEIGIYQTTKYENLNK